MRPNSRISLYGFILISMLVTLVIYWFGYNKPTYGIDDANIYFVYMKHLAGGQGFVWNIGGERVEGFTSLLWTLIGSGFYRIVGERFVWLLLPSSASPLPILPKVRVAHLPSDDATGRWTEIKTDTDVLSHGPPAPVSWLSSNGIL